MKSYTMKPLSEQELAAYDGFSHMARISSLDLTNLTTGATQDITIGPIPLGSSVLAELNIVAGLKNKSDPGFNTITVSLGDDASATSLIAATEVGGNANQVYNDGATNSNTTVTSVTAAFVAGDVGKRISGGSIPAGATIVSRTNGTTVVISAAATTTATGVTITLPDRTSTPVTTPVVRGTLSSVYLVDSHIKARFTPLTGKALNDVNTGEIQFMIKLINPRALGKLKSLATDK